MTDAASGPLPVTANFINPETMHRHPPARPDGLGYAAAEVTTAAR